MAPGAQVGPSVYGKYLVWQDNRKSPSLGTSREGCENCPENRSDIYLYDFSSGKERPLAEDKWLKADPVVYENLVAWVTYRGLFDSRIVVLDLATGKQRTASRTGMAATRPLLSAGRLLWVVRSACDVLPWRPNTGVYLQDLSTKRTRKLTSFVEPSALLDQRTVIIEEGCMLPGRAYTVTIPE